VTTLPLTPVEAGEQTVLASAEIVQSVMLVSSSTAANWLERNARNRPISTFTVERYRKDMAEGRWVYAADPIRFDSMGALLDGQHRLTALASVPELTVPFLVVRGLPTESQLVMDQGRKRSAGQQLALKDVKNSSNVAAGVKVYMLWQTGLMFRDSGLAQTTITTPSIEAFVDEHPLEIATVNDYFSAIRNNDAPPSVAFAAALRFTQIDTAEAHDFFHRLASGGTGVGHPINTLDKRLQRVRREGLRMNTRDYLAFFVLAWNAVREGKSMSKFQRPAGGRWKAETFPVAK